MVRYSNSDKLLLGLQDYIHRVGRTARAGRSGKAITFVSQYDIELYQRIEQLIGKKLPLYETVDDEVMAFRDRRFFSAMYSDWQIVRLADLRDKIAVQNGMAEKSLKIICSESAWRRRAGGRRTSTRRWRRRRGSTSGNTLQTISTTVKTMSEFGRG